MAVDEGVSVLELHLQLLLPGPRLLLLGRCLLHHSLALDVLTDEGEVQPLKGLDLVILSLAEVSSHVYSSSTGLLPCLALA